MNQIQSQTHHTPIGAEPEYFSPAEYFLGIAKDAVAAHDNVCVSLPGVGNITMYPEQRVYYHDVADLAGFCRAPVVDFEVAHLKKEKGGLPDNLGHPGNIQDLLWQAAFHVSDGRLVESRSNGEAVHIYDVIRFTRWPNLTRLPRTENTMRICALLTRHPSSILLVPRKLGIAPEEVFQVYSAACSYGIVNVISNHLGKADSHAEIEEDGEHYSDHAEENGLLRSLFNKISGL